MNTRSNTPADAEAVVLRLLLDLAPIGSVTYGPRLNGYAIFEDDVMFGFVAADSTIYLRTTPRSGAYFQTLGSTKHTEMPYWSLPEAARHDTEILRHLAYEAADTAHLAASFGIDDLEPEVELFLTKGSALGRAITCALIAA